MPKRLTPRGEAAPPVEPIVTGATLPSRDAVQDEQHERPSASDSGVRYIRNLHHIQARVTLTSGRKIELQPRGQREDLDIVNAKEQVDPKFLANKDLIFEVIGHDEAQKIIASQQTNATRQAHSLWDHLRNAQGAAYEQRAATIEQAFEQQGVVVGQIEETGAGRATEKNVEVRRAGPQFTQVPGSPGHPATEYMQSVPSEIDPQEYHEFLLWKCFRQAMAAEQADATPEEVRESLNVTVEPTQTEDAE